MKLEDWIKSLSEELDESMRQELAELNAARTQLAAWHSLFGTTQLSHAVAERDRLRRENAQLAASLLVVKKYADSWRGFPNDVAIVLEQHATALHYLLTPLADTLAHARGGADFGSWRDIRDVELSLRAFKEGK